MVPEGQAGTITFPEMSGWDQPEKPQLYSPETLYECIDGAADLYLSYEFQELSVAEYANAQKASVTVEISRHATPTEAFGIYSQERLTDAKIFVIEGRDQDDCRGMIEKYPRETRTPGEAAEGVHRLKDRHHGDADLLWKGRLIWGTLNLDDPGLRSKYLKEIEGRAR